MADARLDVRIETPDAQVARWQAEQDLALAELIGATGPYRWGDQPDGESTPPVYSVTAGAGARGHRSTAVLFDDVAAPVFKDAVAISWPPDLQEELTQQARLYVGVGDTEIVHVQRQADGTYTMATKVEPDPTRPGWATDDMTRPNREERRRCKGRHQWKADADGKKWCADCWKPEPRLDPDLHIGS